MEVVMKLLIAADGDSLDSRVARRFGNAAWYFLIDADSLEWTATRRSRDIGSILQWAFEGGAKIVVAGHVGARMLNNCRAFGFGCAHARTISISEAVSRHTRGELHTVPVPQTGLPILGWFPWRPFASLSFPRLAPRPWWVHDPVTPRGRHHLQQLSGRGH